MRDIELYRALLGLTAPWTVVGVDVDMTGQRVVVRVNAGPGPYPCPECGTSGPGYDSKPRRWRHLCSPTVAVEIPRSAAVVLYARKSSAYGRVRLHVPNGVNGRSPDTPQRYSRPCHE